MVEMLIAMAVGLFLVGGILQVLVSSRASYRLAEVQARVQENGRYAAQILAKDLRGARSSGCRSIALEEARKSLTVLACDLLDPTDAQAACSGGSALGSEKPMGYSASEQRDDPARWLAGLPGNASSGGGEQKVRSQWLRGDVLVSWGSVGEGTYVEAPGSLEVKNGETDEVTFSGTVDLVAPHEDLVGGRLALITDCEATDIFTITNPHTRQHRALDLPSALEHALNYDSDGAPFESDSAESDPSYTDRSASKVNLRGDLARAYNRQGTATSPGTSIRARVFPFDYMAFYICCTDTRTGTIQEGGAVGNCGNAPARYRPALCRWSASDGAQQLVSDVADLRVTYDGGLDTGIERGRDADFNPTAKKRFSDMTGVVADAKWVSDRGYWDKVDSARVELLVTSADEVRTAAAVSPVHDADEATDLGYGLGADRRIYDIFDVTVATRATSPWYVRE